MHDEELLALLTENKSMSGKLDEYEGQKSTSITTAKRLSEFLGAEMIKDKGLTCQMIIACKPIGEKVTERAIPTAIFSTEEAVKRHFLRKWLKDPNMQDFDIRTILDWEYYRGRFAATVQKIVSLPAAFQNVRNPVPRIELPEWMRKQVREKNSKQQQGSLSGFIKKVDRLNGDVVAQLIDMEDLGGIKRTGSSSKLFGGKKRKHAIQEDEKSEVVEEVEDIDDQDAPKLGEVEFQTWLRHRKGKWKSLLLKRKRQREELTRSLISMDGSSSSSSKRLRTNAVLGGGFGMENFVMRNTTSSLSREAWQIVEILPDQAGIFTCWVVTGDSQLLHRITLRIPRIFYIELADHVIQDGMLSSLENYLPSNVARRVVRVLPHATSSKPQQVVEIVLSEQQYQQHQKELSQILGDPLTVAGIYELHVSALTRAVCALGCVVRVNRPSGALGVDANGYELDDLQFQSTVQVPYLHVTTGAPSAGALGDVKLRRVLLYFAQQNRRAILGIAIIRDEQEETVVGEARVWFVDPFTSTKPRRSELEQIFTQLRQDAAAAGVTTTMTDCVFKEVQVLKEVSEAFNAASGALSRIVSDKQAHQQTPTIVLAQSTLGSSKRLREKIPGLHAFPVSMLPWHEEDSLFPALTWRPVLSERMLLRWMEMGPYFQDVLECARYAHIPVGNFTGDHSLAILDTLYSRMLSKSKHLWWHSTTSLPDLGGREQELAQQQYLLAQTSVVSRTGDDRSSHGSTGKSVSVDAVNVAGPASDAVVCARGSYEGICVDLELDGLAVNALLVAAQLDSIEGISTHQVSLDFDDGKGGAGAQKDGGSSTATTRPDDGDTDRCEEAFRLLRAMVTNLFKDFVASRNKFADHLLQQFYRWLCSPHALCYDPALLARVKQLMEKVFLQLLAELRRLGAQIIFADLSKIVLCTGKDDLENAQTYVTFILQTVLRKELFQVLSLTPRKYYAHLFFLDAENYGAVMLKDMTKATGSEEGDENDDEEENTQDKGLEIISHWNIANHLPRGIDDYFLLLVGQFIRRRAEFQQRASQKASNGGRLEDDAEAMEQAQLAEEGPREGTLATGQVLAASRGVLFLRQAAANRARDHDVQPWTRQLSRALGVAPRDGESGTGAGQVYLRCLSVGAHGRHRSAEAQAHALEATSGERVLGARAVPQPVARVPRAGRDLPELQPVPVGGSLSRPAAFQDPDRRRHDGRICRDGQRRRRRADAPRDVALPALLRLVRQDDAGGAARGDGAGALGAVPAARPLLCKVSAACRVEDARVLHLLGLVSTANRKPRAAERDAASAASRRRAARLCVVVGVRPTTGSRHVTLAFLFLLA
ncbi:hypothetical protein PINS_up014570 [Pythium insidiosum]|nr:hypothetical protein PINS_up014570 [Pythium insidiosum]